MYLNEIYLAQGAYGITAAAMTYFDKKLDELTVGEASFLAALPKAPSFYHPVKEKKRTIQRRNFVIKELNEKHFSLKSEIENNQKDYEKLIDQAADEISNFVEKANLEKLS